MKNILSILLFTLPLLALGNNKPIEHDTIDIGYIYAEDTLVIRTKIVNRHFKASKILSVKWKSDGQFSKLLYNRAPIPPQKARAFRFRVQNSKYVSHKVEKTLIIQTANRLHQIHIYGEFKPDLPPHKKYITRMQDVKKIIAESTSKDILCIEAPEGNHDRTDTSSIIKPLELLEEPENKPTKIVCSPSELTDSLIKYSTEFMGVPYLYGGTSPDGFDCSGFVRHVYRGISFDLPRTSRMQAKIGVSIKKRNAKPGDLVFFEGSKKNGVVGHVGMIIYVDNKGIVFIHASTGKGVSMAETSYDYYSERLLDIRRVLN